MQSFLFPPKSGPILTLKIWIYRASFCRCRLTPWHPELQDVPSSSLKTSLYPVETVGILVKIHLTELEKCLGT